MATKRRTYKRDRRGRFASTGRSRIRRVSRRRPRYVRGSIGSTVRLGRVGPGGAFAGIHVGAQLRSRKRGGEFYVGLSAGRKIPTPY